MFAQYRPNPLSYGGALRQLRRGRVARPLSGRNPIHLVLKANRTSIGTGFRTYKRFQRFHQLLLKYSTMFFVKIEQVSLQGDHIHLLVRAGRRSNLQNFFRVLAGQVAQVFEKENLLSNVTGTQVRLWRFRPFTRVVTGWRGYRIIRNYIQLNEKEALGHIPYRKSRLRGLTAEEWAILWT